MATAAETVTRLKEALSSSPGMTELVVDGIRIKLDKNALDYWERRAAREATPDTRPLAATINLSGS